MVESKAWNWETYSAPWWEEPAGEVYPLLKRWKNSGFNKILDLGCGIGRHAILFAQNGFKVSALDLGEEGLKKLKKSATDLKLSIEIKHADMIKLPYKNSSFDAILAFHSIYHQDDAGTKKVIGEMKRVLKAGGEMFVTFNSKNGSAFNSPDVKRISGNTVMKTEGHEAGIPHFLADKDDIKSLLKDFEIIEISYKEEYYSDYLSAHYFVLAKKPD